MSLGETQAGQVGSSPLPIVAIQQGVVRPLPPASLSPVADSSGICYCGRHDKKGVGRYGILKAIDVAQEVREIQADPQQLFRTACQVEPQQERDHETADSTRAATCKPLQKLRNQLK